MTDRADAPHTVHRVRIRPGVGPGAATRGRRLTRIAHQQLGSALDRALADVADDLVVERITVTFPGDPDELDDEAVAMLWASLVRASLERLLGTPSSSSPEPAGTSGADVGATSRREAALAEAGDLVRVVGALQRWVRDGTPPTPAELGLAAGDPALAERALAELSQPWQALARQLLDQATAGPPVAGPVPPGGATSGQPSATTSADRPARSSAAGRPPYGARYDASAHADRSPAAVTAADEPAARPGTRGDVAGVAVSPWGGLVLLHYRLRPYLEQAVTNEPGLDPVAVRTAALALLVANPTATDDPLARLLAGHPEWAAARTADDPSRIEWRDISAAAARAEDLLRAFAGDLPGFATSSAGFVREQWVHRRALLLDDPPAVLLTLERRPLDLVLDRLPYPVGALRLPWTPPLFTGWERP